MIYGGVQSDFSKSFNTNISAIQKGLDWADSELHEINWRNFKGGILINKSHPYVHTDFYTIDKSDSVLVLFSGTIYNKVDLLPNLKIAGNNNSCAELILCSYKTFFT